ncbi:subtilisin-like protease SBT3.5 isoform X2 [Humulus lupulus]|uniref:subtilisin-like protease SBT3.5 isoform X2 n=1 Tax=Humulus lupulus TaxID=3486 RepID=UPI002B40AC25|nr:subtilisin-like protease SBT3.5 isoform X2 [Humulus lupulus]
MDFPLLATPLLLLLCLIFVLHDHTTTTMVEAKTNNVHIVYMGEKQHVDPDFVTDSHLNLLAKIVGSKERASELMVYSYRHGFSGFAAKLTESQAQDIAELPGVVRVIPNSLHRLQTTRTWDSLDLTTQAPSNLLHKSNNGDGVIIGIFDTGIWPESKSFSENGLGPVPSRWKGVCESGESFDPTKHCNQKIIGARWFVKGFLAEYGKPLNASGEIEYLSARDANGHGTHTASTAAGSFVGNVSYKGLANGTARGGASNARVAVYKVCWNFQGGQCSSADILKAFDKAIHDGVDVLSLSIGFQIPMFSDVDERNGIATGSFHAVARGISVVCAAGNSGPSAQTVQNTAPWILTVAASSIDREFLTSITLGNNKTLTGKAIYDGRGVGLTGLLYPESNGLDPTASGVCEALQLNQTNVAGQVVLCFTSMTRPVTIMSAAAAVKAAGGVGLIVAKHPTSGLYPCPGDFPCIEVDYEVGTKILFYIRSTRIPLAKLSPSKTVVGRPLSAQVAQFSSRGPNSIEPAILKPDITAPGVNVLAATSPHDRFADGEFVMHSGTSMSTPHISGIVALLKALHPTWSPAAIKSALVTTAWRTSPSGSPIFAKGSPPKLADPFDYGGGIVNPNAAADPGLVYDMDMADCIHYLCAMHYNNSVISQLTGNVTNCPIRKLSVLDVNLPSIIIPSIRSTSITVTRTVTNVGAQNSTYRPTIEPPSGIVVSVRPDVLTFNSTVKKVSFKVTFSTTLQMNTQYLFGSLTWSDRVHFVRIPLAVRTEMFQPYGDEY